MGAIRKTLTPGETGRDISLSLPQNFGSKAEIIIHPKFEDKDKSDYFGFIGSDGTEYNMQEWTDEAFDMMGLSNFFKEDDTGTEDVFHVWYWFSCDSQDILHRRIR